MVEVLESVYQIGIALTYFVSPFRFDLVLVDVAGVDWYLCTEKLLLYLIIDEKNIFIYSTPFIYCY